MFDKSAYELLPHLLETLKGSIIVDKNGKIVFFSENYAELSNLPSEYFIGKYVKDAIPNTGMDVVLATGKEEMGQLFIPERLDGSSDDSNVPLCPPRFINRTPIYRDGDYNKELLGAFASISLDEPYDMDRVTNQIKQMQRTEKLMQAHLIEIYHPAYSLDSIKGCSESIKRLKSKIAQVAKSSITVVVTGETGTGKELVASAIHSSSLRYDEPFIRINCASIPENLLESELFGYEPGSFTGALKSGKLGKFELANHGTILLDEIAEMPLSLQAKLLRVLQEKEIERIGSKKPIPIDVRVICSTNKDLFELVKSGQFREDLYYRINVMEITAPPLRERLEDIPELCDYFLLKCHEKGYGMSRSFDPAVYELLKKYSWPGNVRELEHSIECACVLNNGYVIKKENFSFLNIPPEDMSNTKDYSKELSFGELSRNNYTVEQCSDTSGMKNVGLSSDHQSLYNTSEQQLSSFYDKYAKAECDELEYALKSNYFNISKTAEVLGLNRGTLYRKLKKYGLYPFK